MKVAYLVNQYPKVSHTFIRREIAALEADGVEVVRWSIRPCPDRLVDEADKAEEARTRVVLRAGPLRLLGGLLRTGLAHPLRTLGAGKLALDVGWRSDRGPLLHLAYLVEACLLRDWAAAEGIEHVHAHFGTNSAAVAMLCHELGGPPYSVTCHGPKEFDRPEHLGLGEKIARARFVAGVSSFGRSQLYRWTRAEEWDKVHVVPCGVDEAFFAAPPRPVPAAPRLCSVGRICEQKGQLLLVRALALLAREGRAAELVLVGDGELRPAIEALARAEGIAERVTITGWADGARVREELLASRALCMPSFAEGLPVAIMEALALGRPVISTWVAGIPELVTPEVGWLVPAGSVEALAGAMRRVLDASPAELERMGQAGRERVRARHDVRLAARALEALFAGREPEGEQR
jgi:glycosyltransferase involved in cell wall biosynthesis